VPVAVTWGVELYKDERGRFPVKEFLEDRRSITDAENKQFLARLLKVREHGLSLIRDRADILEKLSGQRNLYSMRLDNTTNNHRFLLCALPGRRLVLLHAFKESSSHDYDRAIAKARTRRDRLEAKEGQVDED